MNYMVNGIGHGYHKGGVFGIDKDVLSKSSSIFSKALSDGDNKEFWAVMEKNSLGEFQTTHEGEGKEGSGQADGFPTQIQSDVSIHSHPIGTKKIQTPLGQLVESSPANEPSGTDANDIFPRFNMNIIVGKQGKSSYTSLPNGEIQINDYRGAGINIWNTGNFSLNPDFSISGEAAGKMLNGNRGSLGKKFDKQKK